MLRPVRALGRLINRIVTGFCALGLLVIAWFALDALFFRDEPERPADRDP